MMTYPLGVLDNVSVQEYIGWQDHLLYQVCQWQRTYDTVMINASLFHYPESGRPLFAQQTTASAAGYGVRLMLVYTH